MKGQKMMLEKSRNFIESIRFPIAIFSYENHKVKNCDGFTRLFENEGSNHGKRRSHCLL